MTNDTLTIGAIRKIGIVRLIIDGRVLAQKRYCSRAQRSSMVDAWMQTFDVSGHDVHLSIIPDCIPSKNPCGANQVVDSETGVVYRSVSEAAREFGIARHKLELALRGVKGTTTLQYAA